MTIRLKFPRRYGVLGGRVTPVKQRAELERTDRACSCQVSLAHAPRHPQSWLILPDGQSAVPASLSQRWDQVIAVQDVLVSVSARTVRIESLILVLSDAPIAR